MTVYKSLIFLFLCCLLPIGLSAQPISVKQGEILRLSIPIDAQDTEIQALGLHQSWPVFLEGNRATAVIGIDVYSKVGDYTLIWKGKKATIAWQKSLTFHIAKQNFRESYITVKKKMASFDAKALARIRADQAAIGQAWKSQITQKPRLLFRDMPVQGVISTPFGARRIVNGQARSPHAGIDIAAPLGSPIHAPLAGKVVLAESMFLNGNSIAIAHGHGLVSVYTHVQKLEVKTGDWLETGQVFAHIGMTGRSTGSHLHWGIRLHQARINPLALLPQ